MKEKLKTIATIILLIVIILGVPVHKYATNTEEAIKEMNDKTIPKVSVLYSSHVQDYGWEKDFCKADGEQSGTTGKNKKTEAIKIKLNDAPKGMGIKYQLYVQGNGWQEWKKDGQEAGSTGQNKKMEGIKIELTGTKDYSVEYKIHVEDFGWLDWKKDGEIAGTIGQNKKIEAIEIRIISKSTYVVYNSHVENYGWQKYSTDGETSGIVGKKLKVEAMHIEIKNLENNINILYKSHVQDFGWEKTWKRNGEESGTTGQNKKIEAVRIKLEDPDVIGKYSILYRAYVEGKGWQEWKKDGEEAGTTGQNKKLEAIEIKIVEKEPSNEINVRYTTHIQDYGWMGYTGQGNENGIIGEDKKIEAIKIVGLNLPENVKIKYKSHVQDFGWESEWITDGKQSGTTGKNKKVEAVRIELEGTDKYSIEYKTYVQGEGWQAWANDGEISGTTGKNKKLEAIAIRIVPKITNRIMMCIDTPNYQHIEQSQFKVRGWLMTNIKDAKLQLVVNGKILDKQFNRVERNDVLDAVKGFGGDIHNPKPGYEITVDLTKELGNKEIKVQCVDSKGKVLEEQAINVILHNKITYSTGTYGVSGLKKAGKGGSDLPYYKWGNGENVFFATYALHGYEDLWDKDGYELVDIANQFFNKLKNEKDYNLSDKWTIYIFPGVNQDGLKSGTTKNGPGRTTLYSQAPANKGIDLNRCWQVGNEYVRYTSNRNYNGTQGFQAYEAQALRDFLLANKSKNGQTILVDLHGWTQQIIGEASVCSYYQERFPENKPSLNRYGTGYLIDWARTYLGSNKKAAKSALIELPKDGVTGHQSVLYGNFANRYMEATIKMLKNIEI